MNTHQFFDPNNQDYQIQVIAPTHTYGIVNSLESRYDFEVTFDEYDPEGLWEYNIIIKGEIVETFNHLEEVEEYLMTIEK